MVQYRQSFIHRAQQTAFTMGLKSALYSYISLSLWFKAGNEHSKFSCLKLQSTNQNWTSCFDRSMSFDFDGTQTNWQISRSILHSKFGLEQRIVVVSASVWNTAAWLAQWKIVKWVKLMQRPYEACCWLIDVKSYSINQSTTAWSSGASLKS